MKGVDARPSAEVLNRIARALDTSPDYLINGTVQDRAEYMISDNELQIMFRKAERLPEDKKRLKKGCVREGDSYKFRVLGFRRFPLKLANSICSPLNR